MSVQRVTPTLCLTGLDSLISAMFSPMHSGVLRMNRVARVIALLPQGTPSKQWSACRTRMDRSIKELKIDVPVIYTGRTSGQIMELFPVCFDFIDEATDEGSFHSCCSSSIGAMAPNTTLLVDVSEGGNIAAIIAMGYMVIARHWTLADACAQIKAAHPNSQPDPCLLFQLIALERAFKGGLASIDMNKVIQIFQPGLVHEKQVLPDVSRGSLLFTSMSCTTAIALATKESSTPIINNKQQQRTRGIAATLREAIFGKPVILPSVPNSYAH